MNTLCLETFVLGDLFTNSYLIFDPQTKKAFMVDAPAPGEEVRAFIERQELTLDFIILTHGHFDHIGACPEFGCPVHIHTEDVPLLGDPHLNASAFCGTSFVLGREPVLLEEGQFLSFGQQLVEVIHTPGHTPGSVSLRLGSWLFSGDTLFCNSVGRTDIPLASGEKLLSSIREKLLVLAPETIVYPGHGPSTTIADEKANNPFI